MAKKDNAKNRTQEKKPVKSSGEAKKAVQPQEVQPIVAIGASAGGLEALKKFFENMPADSGIGFVILTHTRPKRETMLPDLLSNITDIPVFASKDGTRVQPNQVIVAKDSFLSIKDGKLYHVEVEEESFDTVHHPIDQFFRELAADQREHAICVVLSGSGNDGTIGLKAIKAAGGMVMVQEPSTAKYAAMPESAQATGMADFVLPPDELPAALIDYCKGPYLKLARREEAPLLPDDTVHAILVRLRSHTGHDFTHYKKSTMTRRIERRMNVHRIDEPQAYLRYLRENTREMDLLLQELLISVTSFFRNPAAFQALADKALPELIKKREDGHIFRVWVAGCATGEEAYSIAILMDEQIRKSNQIHEAQIFATDLDKQAIDVARNGLYPEGIAADVSQERLNRYFSREDGSYRIHKNIRDMVVFAVQNVVTDPPFTRMDMIVCRNLLIYLNNNAQDRLLPLFHYALRPDGLLFLGSSETIARAEELFEMLDSKHKILRRKEKSRPAHLALPSFGKKSMNEEEVAQRDVRAEVGPRHLSRTVERLLLSQFAPCSVVVDEQDTVVYIHGRSGTYFQPEEGQPRNNIVEMAREGLRFPLAQSLRRARGENKEVIQPGLRVRTNGEYAHADLKVRPLHAPESVRGLFLITIHPTDENKGAQEIEVQAPAPSMPDEATEATGKEELELELQYTRENLQTTIEELETSNEELKSSNEELQSTNEELQSSNEELETSREELESLNEELNTVNAELKAKVDALARSNDDMNNLLNSMQIAAIFLDSNLHVKRYTKKAQDIIRLIDSDIGRPLSDLTSNLQYDNLVEDCQNVLESLSSQEKEVQENDGKYFMVRMMPYRTSENIIDGVVLTILDIDQTKRAEREVQSYWEFFEAIVQTTRHPLLVLDSDLKVVQANAAFYNAFDTNPENTQERMIYKLGNKQWDIPELRNLLEEILPRKSVITDFRVEHDFPSIGRRVFLLNARHLMSDISEFNMILLAFEDVTQNES